jgi:bifunctional non-homologous end joining protein LigD
MCVLTRQMPQRRVSRMKSYPSQCHTPSAPESQTEVSGVGFSPLRLASLPHAFDDREFVFELKYDGFRALAHVNDSRGVRLISRNGYLYKIFPRLTTAIADVLKGRDAVIDGEIVCLGADGKPRFYDLLRSRGPQHFCAFDLLRLDGRDLRNQPLIERRRMLKALIPPQPCALICVDYVEKCGTAFFDECCRLDLEGIVAKQRDSRYIMDGPFRRAGERTAWAKIRNHSYSQWQGRHELFRKRRP